MSTSPSASPTGFAAGSSNSTQSPTAQPSLAPSFSPTLALQTFQPTENPPTGRTAMPTVDQSIADQETSYGFGQFLVFVFLIVLLVVIFRIVRQYMKRRREAQQQEGIEFGHIPDPVTHRVEVV